MTHSLPRRQALGWLAAATLSTFGGAAQAADELLVWINGDKGYEGVAKIGEKFAKDTGVKVRVEHPEDAISKFEQAAAVGKGPDIWIWAHDRAGSWISAGLIAPVTPSKATVDGIDPMAWQAWTLGGKTWGYPISIEAVGLIYNKALLPRPPEDWAEVLALDKKLSAGGADKHAILWPITQIYYSYGLISPAGGYAFKRRPDGSYDPKDTGVNQPGAVKGVQTIVDLVKAGALPRTATYADAEARFNEGKVAMMINGPWSWANLKKSRIDFGVAPYPKIDGKPGGPMYGVVGAMISTASTKKEIAAEFLENYLLGREGLAAMNAHVPLGVPANKAYYEAVKGDPHIAGMMATAQAGVPMPNNPEMTRFWSAMEAALANITQGREGVKQGLDRAAQRIVGD